MLEVIFIEHNGTRHSISAEPGSSLMHAAIDHGVPGIDADCGGNCACATCHVYVDDAWLAKTGAMHETEDGMLSMSTERKPNSRLSCQIELNESLDGLVVSTPEFQY